MEWAFVACAALSAVCVACVLAASRTLLDVHCGYRAGAEECRLRLALHDAWRENGRLGRRIHRQRKAFAELRDEITWKRRYAFELEHLLVQVGGLEMNEEFPKARRRAAGQPEIPRSAEAEHNP